MILKLLESPGKTPPLEHSDTARPKSSVAGGLAALFGTLCNTLRRSNPGDVQMAESVPEVPILLDVSGLNCPMPLLKAKKALNGMPAGALLRVIATDPASVRDFEVFAQQSGNALLESTQTGNRFEYLLRKKG
jgi:tRNA 2-thiouridine synthesizing protein A